VYDFVWDQAFLRKVEQFSHLLVLLSTAVKNVAIKSIEEETEAKRKRIQTLTLTPEILIAHGEHASSQSSRSSSSIRMTRRHLIENIDENKNVWIEKWINDGE